MWFGGEGRVRRRYRGALRRRRLDAEPGDIQRRQEQQRQNGADDDAAHHRIGHRAPENLARDRDQRQGRGGGGQQDRPHAVLGRLHHRVPRRAALGAVLFDLDDQNDRVADQNADQRQHPQDRDEAQRRVARQQRGDDADKRQRRDGENQEQPLKTLQLQHQDGRHDEQHQRRHRGDRPLRLRALFHGAAGRDLIAGGQRGR